VYNVIAERDKTQEKKGKRKMKTMTITNKMYTDFIKNAIETEGYKVADIANKMALETKAITLDQYRAAAQLIVEAYKKANW
jgi:ribosome-binding protein aMBF1 (putative translation factor)